MARWNKNGGLTCKECDEKELKEHNIVSCETCNRPRPLESNYLVLEIYSYNPVKPIPMTDGLVMLDINAIEYLFKLYEVPLYEQKKLLEYISIYHNELYSKEKNLLPDNTGGKEG